MARVLSGIQPTGDTHIGNYVGAIRHWPVDQHANDSFFFIADLHALDEPMPGDVLADKTLDLVAILLSAGIDPERSTLFVQSHVPEHTELCWLLNCVAGFGELQRMTQFKDRIAKSESASAALFDYPVLMAADILLYDTDLVPVGDDQRQHLELCRDVAARFNKRYGDTFTVPRAATPKVGARIMDLQDPTMKMSKSQSSPQGLLKLLEVPEQMTRKIKRAVTDTESEVRYEPATKPGVSNLLELLSVATGDDPKTLASRYTSYGALKDDTAAAVVEFVRPVQQRFGELRADVTQLERVVADGAEKARAVASKTLGRAREAVGLLPRA